MFLDFDSINVVTAPVLEPVSVEEAKLNSRIDATADDAVIARLITTAREQIESEWSVALITQTLDIRFKRFTHVMEFPRAPLQSVTSVKYLDQDEVEQTVDSNVYRIDRFRRPGLITLGLGEVWPIPYAVWAPITVRVVAGHGSTAAAVPAPFKQAILLMVDHWYENRGASVIGRPVQIVPMGAQALLSSMGLQKI